MDVQNIDRLLNTIEENAEDELSFLLSTGPAYFSTAQLLRLKGQWEAKNAIFHKTYTACLRIGASAPVWPLLWMLCKNIGLPFLGLVFLFLFLFSLCFFLGGMLLMRYLFHGNGHLDMVGAIINEELQKRELALY